MLGAENSLCLYGKRFRKSLNTCLSHQRRVTLGTCMTSLLVSPTPAGLLHDFQKCPVRPSPMHYLACRLTSTFLAKVGITYSALFIRHL